jgi:Spy/CpxP family protein refolding chaperone
VKIHPPAFGPNLPIHPFTGLTALGLRRNGQPIWPVRGGSGEGDTGAADGDQGAGDNGQDGTADLGDAGKQAIDRMKAERNQARKELSDVKGQLEKLAPLQKLAEALGAKPDDDGKTDFAALTARLGQHEQELAAERLARFRVEVASEKGLTPAQAKRLNGATREELAADADEILKIFPTAPASGSGQRSGGLRPDPSQGSRGNQTLSGREAGLAEAQKRFGVKSTAT